jgi:tellurite resistance protein TehA-like permease
MWCLDVLLLALFIGLLAARVLCFPSSVRELMEQPNQSMFLGTLPMSISALTGGVVVLLVPR